MSRPALIVAAVVLVVLFVADGEAPAEDRVVPARGVAYIGAERCASCHAAAYAAWAKDPHARAHRSLPPERRADVKCTGCHSPDPGGLFQGVQCESCHGPGIDYAFDFVMKDPKLSRILGLLDAGERRCLSCHGDDGPHGRPFDYRKARQAIVHWSR